MTEKGELIGGIRLEVSKYSTVLAFDDGHLEEED